MKSTGEVMGIDPDFGAAFAKAQLGAGQKLPLSGTVFISVADEDKPAALDLAGAFLSMGFHITATEGTARFLNGAGITCRNIEKISTGRPHVVDAIKNGAVQLIINTGQGSGPSRDGFFIRRAALDYAVPHTTTISAANAVCQAIARLKQGALTVRPLQEYYGEPITMNKPTTGAHHHGQTAWN